MAIYTVTTLADENNGATGGMSLREALVLANGNGATPDTIRFDSGLAGGTLFLTTGQQLAITTTGITINGDIDGDGRADITISADSADGADDANSRVFSIDGAGAISATLNGLVIRDGKASSGAAAGGGIYVGIDDGLTLTNATVSANHAHGEGGGIAARLTSVLTLANVTISGNSADGDGGGISARSGAAITLTNTTVSGNSTLSDGGGIYSSYRPITLVNSTVTGNSADEHGGGLYTRDTVTLVNSIVAGNDASTADDLFSGLPSGSSLTFEGANIIGSAPVNFDPPTGPAPLTIDGTNQAALETVFDTVDHDANTGVLSGVLADNGGPVETVMIRSDGIARDPAGTAVPTDTTDLDHDGSTSDPLPFDARGGQRLIGTTVDIGAVEAGQFIVTTLDDEDAAPGSDLATELGDGTGLSLREALALANADPSTADMITFAPGLAEGTIFLTTGQQLEITTDGITIDGDLDHDGDADITISGDANQSGLHDSGDTRVFFVDDGTSGRIAATLNGLNVVSGHAELERGGGIYVGEGDALALTNATVAGNFAQFDGGGIYAASGSSVTLTNSTLSSNEGDNGGAMFAVGTVTLVDSTVSRNRAGWGGGIYGDGDAITLINSTVYGNYANRDGGGIYVDSGAPLTLVNSTISGNSAGGDGGGLYGWQDNDITLINSTVTGNRAGQSGGGIAAEQIGQITLTNSIVAGNYAGGDGDDLFGDTTSDLTFNGHNIIGSDPVAFNQTTDNGTLTTIDATGTDLATVFDQVDYDPFTGVYSGVLADNGGPVETVLIKTGGIAHNPAGTIVPTDTQDADQDGNDTEALPVDARGLPRQVGATIDIGAVELGVAQDFVVTTLEDQEYDGGDLAAEIADDGFLSLREALALANQDPATADTITFLDTLDDNTTPGVDDGILQLVHGELVIEGDVSIDGDLDGNDTPDITLRGSDSNHSAILHAYTGTVAVNGLTITNGQASYGAGFSVGSYYGAVAHATVTNSVITGNHAVGTYASGGGIYVAAGSSLVLTDSAVTNNDADRSGGGIANYGILTVTNSEISGNTADYSGGGIYSYASCGCGTTGVTTLIDSTVRSNDALAGGGISNYAGHLTITNSIIELNQAIDAGGGIVSSIDALVEIDRSSIINNTVLGDPGSGDGSGGGIHNLGGLYITNSTISGNSVLADNGRGGGLYNTGYAGLANTTVSGNTTVVAGGGIANWFGDLLLINVTIANNEATYPHSAGGGLLNTGAAYLYNSTITGNRAHESGSGVYSLSSEFHISNSIILGNVGGEAYFSAGAYYGRNIIGPGIFEGAVNIGSTSIADVFKDIDALTGGGLLANNGGPVQTVMIKAGGDAHNNGIDTALPDDLPDLDGDTDDTEPLPVDARGFDRIHGPSVDLGAVEIDEAPVVANAIPDQSSPVNTPVNFQFAADAFTDADSSALTFSATLLGGGALPAWLTFTPGTRTFSGTPPQNFFGDLDITVTADDGQSTVDDSFRLTISNAGNDLLISGPGPNSTGVGDIFALIGGAGNDTYAVADEVADITEEVGGGTDTVYSTVTYTMAANVEGMVLQDAGGAIDGTGSDGNDTIFGNSFTNFLHGGEGGDALIGGGGNDVLFGDGGIDGMAGGSGDDTYVVDTISDQIQETTGEGADTVYASASFQLPDNVEGLVLLEGAGAINGAGSEGNDTIFGNSSNNVLEGRGGSDALIGGGGNDVLNGGAGIDGMAGGLGDDTYSVDDTLDQIQENAGEGADTVYASATFTLFANLEALVLVDGAGAINGAGNGGDNYLFGNDSANTLYGLGGNDVMFGGAGIDTLHGDGGNDVMVGGADNDVFVFGVGFGRDSIEDFTAGDHIQFSPAVFADFADVQAHMVSIDPTTTAIVRDGSNAVAVHHVAGYVLTQNDFLFA